MVAAVWSNSAWDEAEDKNARKNMINSLNDSFLEAIEAVDDAMARKDRPEEKKLTDDNPFFAATERGLQKVEQRVKASGVKIQKPVDPEDEIDYMKGLDQE